MLVIVPELSVLLVQTVSSTQSRYIFRFVQSHVTIRHILTPVEGVPKDRQSLIVDHVELNIDILWTVTGHHDHSKAMVLAVHVTGLISNMIPVNAL